MSVRVSYANGGLSDVQVADRPSISGVLPFTASFGPLAFLGTLNMSLVPHDVTVQGVLFDQTGARPFVLDLDQLESQAFAPSARASLLFQPNDRTLFLQPAELVGGRWRSLDPLPVLRW